MDTSALLALLNSRDALHASAVAVFQALRAARTQFVTSEWVLAEYLGSASSAALRQAAARNVRRLFQSPDVVVVRASSLEWMAAFELYEKRADKEWSLVDCATILTCSDRAIRTVFTHDRHSEQAGLEILMR